MIHHVRTLMLCGVAFASFQQASAIVLSYYRFEVDDDPGLGLSTPDELSGFALIADSATVDNSAKPGSLPPFFEPTVGANGASLDGLPGGAASSPNIDAIAAYNSVLDKPELTVELYARTQESTAVLVARSTGTGAGVVNSISDGFRIYDPQSLKVDFWTSDGLGGAAVLHTINSGVAMVDELDVAVWRHLAFSYESGIGKFYMDSVEIGSRSTVAGELYWGASSELFVGIEMDGFDFSKTENDNGYIDELRFSEGALVVDELLPSIPEPTTFTLITGLLAFLRVSLRRRQ